MFQIHYTPLFVKHQMEGDVYFFLPSEMTVVLDPERARESARLAEPLADILEFEFTGEVAKWVLDDEGTMWYEPIEELELGPLTCFICVNRSLSAFPKPASEADFETLRELERQQKEYESKLALAEAELQADVTTVLEETQLEEPESAGLIQAGEEIDFQELLKDVRDFLGLGQ